MLLTEVKLFILTKYLLGLYQTEDKVKEQLKELVGGTDEYLKDWIDRYIEIDESKELQIMLLRHVGYTYRQVQEMVKVSPSNIQSVLKEYTLNYEPLEESSKIEASLNEIETRLYKAGISLW